MKPTVLTFGGARLVDSNGKAIFRNGTTTIGNRTYKTVKIGSQEWLAENLKLEDNGSDIWATQVFGDEEVFYKWDAAVRIAALAGDGWRLPSSNDLGPLWSFLGGQVTSAKFLKSTSRWEDNGNGTDSYGFCVLPVGTIEDGFLVGKGIQSYFWSSNEYERDATQAYRYMYSYSGDGVGWMAVSKQTGIYSVRLVRDA